MRKGVKIGLIIGAIIIAIVAIVIVCCFIFIKDKTPITAEEFKARMEEKGYVISDVTYQFATYEDYIKKVYLAINQDYTYQIEFYDISDADSAQSFFNSNKQIFENSKENTSVESSVSLKNYSKYTLTTNGKYKVLSRIENTVIYLNIDEQYKDEVQNILKDLGY